jgi:hypothetical protein
MYSDRTKSGLDLCWFTSGLHKMKVHTGQNVNYRSSLVAVSYFLYDSYMS